MFSIANNLSVLLSLVSLLLMAMPIHAGNQYVFPSDIIDQSEQAQYDVERVNRYENQHNWRFPKNPRTQDKNTFYPESRQYGSIDSQTLYEANQSKKEQSEQYQNRKKSSWYEQSDHYKYNDFNSNVHPDTQIRQPAQYYSTNDFNREVQSSKESYSTQFNNEQFRRPPATANKMQQRHFPESFRKPVYASDFDADGYITNKRSVSKNPNAVPSYDSHLYNNNIHNSKSDYAWNSGNDKQPLRVQYVPVPVYNVPGTLPGTIPGIVTPGNMVPGYSHLSPNYDRLNKKDKGVYNLMGSQYNPFTELGVFPGGSNPFNSLYKSYSNNSETGLPFLSPDTRFPAFSKPEAFLSH